MLGVEHPYTLTSAKNLAGALKAQGEFPEAVRILRETLEVRRRALGAEHPNTLASASNLANVLLAQGEFPEAARILDEDENFDHEHLFSENAGKVAFWLVMLLGLALAFEALEIGSIAEPLTDSMNRIIGMLPSLALGGVLIFGGYLLGRLASGSQV